MKDGPAREVRVDPDRKRPFDADAELRRRLAEVVAVLRAMPDPQPERAGQLTVHWAADRLELFTQGKVRTLDAAFKQPGRKRGRKADPATLALAMRVLELRRQGAKWDAIAEGLGIGDESRARQLHAMAEGFAELRAMLPE